MIRPLYILSISGEPVDGNPNTTIEYIGPFDSISEAKAYGDKLDDPRWNVVDNTPIDSGMFDYFDVDQPFLGILVTPQLKE